MNKIIKKIASISLLVVLMTSGLFHGFEAGAAECENSRVEFSFREPNYLLVKDVFWSFHKQEKDIAGKRFLGRAIRSGKITESGSALFEFNPLAVHRETIRGGTIFFALKVYELNRNEGEEIFWDIRIACDKNISKIFTLSRLNVVIRDDHGVPIINHPFRIYTQQNNFKGKPIVDKLVANLSTGISGYKTIHLAAGSYVIQVPTPTNKRKFYEETNVVVRTASDNTFDYRTGNLRVTITDTSGNLLTNISVTLYTQDTSPTGLPEIGKREATTRTNKNGVATFFQPEGVYALQVFGPNRSVYGFFNVSIRSESNNSTVKKISIVEAFTRDTNGALVGGVRMSLHEQKINSDGVPVKGRTVQSVTSNNLGQGTFYVSPGKYVFSVGKEDRYNVVVSESSVTTLVYRIKETARTVSNKEVLVKGITFEIVPHGSVVKSRSSNKVYFIEKGKKRAIPNEATFFAYGFTWPEVRIISAHDLEHYPTDRPLPELPTINLHEGELVKSDQSPAVYLIEDGKKRVFRNGYSFETLRFNYKNIVTVAAFVLDQYADGTVINIPVAISTRLIKAEDTSAVYKVENGLKRPYASEVAFFADGNKWNQVRVVSFSEIRTIPLGSVIR